MIKGSDLINRATGVEAAEAEIRKMKAKPAAPADELAALKARLEAARTLPPPQGIYDGAVWAQGRDAAIAAIEAEA